MSSTPAALSRDAIIFAFAYLNGPRAKLSFGGEGASMRITDRARAALSELLAAGYAAKATPTDAIRDREHYQGVERDPHIGALAKEIGFNPFLAGEDDKFISFEKISDLEAEPSM